MIPAETMQMVEREFADRREALRTEIEVWKQQYEDSTAALWATETKLHAAEARLAEAVGLMEELLGLEPGSSEKALDFIDSYAG